uniref:Condensation domain-containing protein n=1 Tax=Thermosporothrix sp. COM3 TaxID=2490863 RepID=A0A455SMI9_9CHLR|nr:hypothetical protein KTC_28830 [Thermosporothrix sp. COM3]
MIGLPVSKRPRAEMEDLIGFFINTLVLRVNISGDPGFRNLLTHVRAMVLNAQQHQDLSFEQLVKEVHPGRDLIYI